MPDLTGRNSDLAKVPARRLNEADKTRRLNVAEDLRYV